jgi:shikimate kinase
VTGPRSEEAGGAAAGISPGAGLSIARSPMPVMPPDRVVLVGFMGAGKTTVGRELARHLGWRFVDVDDAVVEAAGRSIAQIFATDGESHFRTLENHALQACLAGTQTVLAVGGGAVESPHNLELLAASSRTLTVYLYAPLEILCARCEQAAAQPDVARRPVFEDRAAVGERYSRRLPLYQTVAHVAVAAENPPAVVAAQILEFWSTALERSR